MHINLGTEVSLAPVLSTSLSSPMVASDRESPLSRTKQYPGEINVSLLRDVVYKSTLAMISLVTYWFGFGCLAIKKLPMLTSSGYVQFKDSLISIPCAAAFIGLSWMSVSYRAWAGRWLGKMVSFSPALILPVLTIPWTFKNYLSNDFAAI